MPAADLPPLRSKRLLDQLRERIRFLHCSLRTEGAYVYWCRTFIRFHRLQDPKDLGADAVEAFLIGGGAVRSPMDELATQSGAQLQAALESPQRAVARQ